MNWKRYDTDSPVNPSIHDRFIYALADGSYMINWWCHDRYDAVAWDYITPPNEDFFKPIPPKLTP